LAEEKSPLASPDYFRTAFILSAAAHAVIVALFVVKILFFSKPLIDLSQAISVSVSDLGATQRLPEKKTEPSAEPAKDANDDNPPPKEEPVKESSKPAKSESAKPETLPKKTKPEPKKEEINLSKSKSKQKEAFDKIKKLSALEKIKQDVATESKTGKAAPAKPRVVAAGTELSGLDKIEASDYLRSLDSSIKQYWQLPQWLINKNLRAQVLVKFNTSGQILSTKILTSSGNSNYDNYCLQAITKAAPFPKVPAKFSEKFSIDGLIVGFPE
jgi:colicin import membrane protein